MVQLILVLEFHGGYLSFKSIIYVADEEVGASVSSVTGNFQQLSVTKDNSGFLSGGTAPAVVIPDHLQVQTADCSHLSFGSFGSGMTAPYSSGITAPVLAKSNLEEAHREADISSSGHLDTRYELVLFQNMLFFLSS